MDRIYLIVYLVYGFVYILMGLIAIASSKTTKMLPFYNNLKYIGGFGIIHGLSELVTVIVISNLFFDIASFLFILKRVLKALSFIYLFKFGLCFYLDTTRSIMRRLPEIFFAVWFVVLIYLLLINIDSNQLSVFFNVSIRYFMAFPMGLFVFYSIYKLKDNYQKIPGLRNILYYLSFVFLIYAIVDGLFVRKAYYFPANIINNELFMSVFVIPIQYVKIAIGIATCVLLYNANSKLHSYESIELINYQKGIAIEAERSRLNNMIHDKTIQKLFSSGLMLESLQKQKPQEEKELIDLVVSQLNESIEDLRTTLYEESSSSNQTLKQLTEELMQKWQMVSSLNLSFNYKISEQTEKSLNQRQRSHCMWIIQEMLINSIKHSKGTFCQVEIVERNDHLFIKNYDNGVGFRMKDIKSEKTHGLTSIIDRIKQLGGTFDVESRLKHTVVWVSFPLNGDNQ